MGGRLKLGQILVNRGLLEPDQLAAALAAQQESGARLGMTLVRLGFVDEETLIRTLAGQLKLPVARIRGKRVSPQVLECVPVAVAEKHRCLPLFFKQEGGRRVLFVAMEDPSDTDALDEIARASGEALHAVLVGPTELEEALQRHYHWASLTGEAPDWSAAPSGGPADEDAGESGAIGADPDSERAPDPDPEPERDLESDPEPDADPDLDAGFDPGPDPDAALELGPDADDGFDLGLDAATDDEDEDDPLAAALLPDDEDDRAETTPSLPEGGMPEDDDPFDRADLDLGADDPADPVLAAPAPVGAELPRTESLDPRIILRALSQLLVEKGVIGRDEFVQRLGELAAREAGRG